jgi:hypothetical protein
LGDIIMRRFRPAAVLGTVAALLLAPFATAAPVAVDTTLAAPASINARQFTLTTDMTSLAGYVAALDLALSSRRRTVDQVMQAANRDRGALCNSSAYQPALDRWGSSVQGFCWNDGDDAADHWYPQGITSTRDALDAGQYDNHQLVATTWYHKPENDTTGSPNKGIRLSLVDWDADWANTYRHLLLVEPVAGSNYKAIPIHAGGAFWYGDLLYVADTGTGFRIFDFRKIYSVDTGRPTAIGRQSDGTYHAADYAYVMPQVGWVRNAGASLRYSFASLDRATTPDSMVVGEWTPDTSETSRVVRFPLDYTDRLPVQEADGKSYGKEAYSTGFLSMQGVVARDGRFWFSSSAGGGGPTGNYGTLRIWNRGSTTVTAYSWTYGAEDLSYWPDAANPDAIWSLTEYPDYRAVIQVPSGLN